MGTFVAFTQLCEKCNYDIQWQSQLYPPVKYDPPVKYETADNCSYIFYWWIIRSTTKGIFYFHCYQMYMYIYLFISHYFDFIDFQGHAAGDIPV